MLQAVALPLHVLIFFHHPLVPLVAHQTDGVAHMAQPLISVVLAVEEAVLGARCHHTVGFVGPLGHQVVNENADVALASVQDQGLPTQNLQGGVDTGHKALDGGLLIAGGAVELTSTVEAGHLLVLQGGQQLGGVHTVVLNGVGRAGHLGVFQTGQGAHHLDLHILRQRGGEALDVNLLGIQAHGLQEELVAVLVGEAHHFVLNGRAVPGANPLNGAGEEGGTVQIGPDDVVGVLVGVGDPAADLVLPGLFGLEGEGDGFGVPHLDLQLGKVDGPGIDPGRGAGLEPAQGQSGFQQTVGQGIGTEHAIGSASADHFTHNGGAAQVGAGTDDGRLHPVDGPSLGLHAHHLAVFREKVGNLGLLHPQVGFLLQGVLHDALVEAAVSLGPEGVDGRSLASVQDPVLDAGLVCRSGHLTAQGVQLPDQMALAGAADGGVAGHVAHGIHVDGKA